MTVATTEEAKALKSAILETIMDSKPNWRDMQLIAELVNYLCGTGADSMRMFVLATQGMSLYNTYDRTKIELFLNVAKRVHNGEVDDDRLHMLEKQLITKRVRINSEVQLLLASPE